MQCISIRILFFDGRNKFHENERGDENIERIPPFYAVAVTGALQMMPMSSTIWIMCIRKTIPAEDKSKLYQQ